MVVCHWPSNRNKTKNLGDERSQLVGKWQGKQRLEQRIYKFQECCSQQRRQVIDLFGCKWRSACCGSEKLACRTANVALTVVEEVNRALDDGSKICCNGLNGGVDFDDCGSEV